jgi:hypothetical protein
MSYPAPAYGWPLSWREAYEYDLIEVLGQRLSSFLIEAGEAASRWAPRFVRERMTVHTACLVQRVDEPG